MAPRAPWWTAREASLKGEPLGAPLRTWHSGRSWFRLAAFLCAMWLSLCPVHHSSSADNLLDRESQWEMESHVALSCLPS